MSQRTQKARNFCDIQACRSQDDQLLTFAPPLIALYRDHVPYTCSGNVTNACQVRYIADDDGLVSVFLRVRVGPNDLQCTLPWCE